MLIYGGAGFPKVPGAKSMNKYHVKGEGKGLTGSSKNLWKLITYAVEEKRKIPVMLETPAVRLITSAKGEVVGAVAKSKGKEITIKARKAVVMTTGGYEFNERDLKNFVKGYPIYALGSPGNTGDGIRMAQKVGAGLWHMNGVSCPLGIKVPEIEAAFTWVATTPRHIMVDKHGKRFVNEKAVELHAGLLAVDYFDTHELDYPRIPCYVIFDETARKAGPITALAGMGYAGRKHSWSRDNSVEVEKGWILKGNTIAELAGKIKTMDAETAGKDCPTWNEDVAKGEDTQFHRPMRSGDPSAPPTRNWRPLCGRPRSTRRPSMRSSFTPRCSTPRAGRGEIQRPRCLMPLRSRSRGSTGRVSSARCGASFTRAPATSANA